ncbi:unnamed protein product, partial [marine sediment metagenome]
MITYLPLVATTADGGTVTGGPDNGARSVHQRRWYRDTHGE